MPYDYLQPALPHIASWFDWSPQRVWSRRELEGILSQMRANWWLPSHVTATDFIQFLLDNTPLDEIDLDFPRAITRYGWKGPTAFRVAMSIQTGGYFWRHTAMWLHGLTSDEPSVLYLNIEQRGTGKTPGALQQAGIDSAFQRPSRSTSNRAHYGDVEICIVEGKNSGRYSVIEREHPEHGSLQFTSLERTLIDILVRPAYSGGVRAVLQAYRLAAGRVDCGALLNALLELDYTYPYHQAVGFYMQRAGGYSQEAIELFRGRGLEYDFYLDYQMTDPAYSPEWRIYYPRELDVPA